MPFHGPNADRVSIHLGREIKNSAPMVQPMNKLTPRLPPPPPPPPPLAFFRQACFEQLVLEKNSTDPSDRRSGKERRGSRTAPSLVHNKSTDSPDRSPPSTSNDNTTNGSDGSAYVYVRAAFYAQPSFLFLSLPPPPLSLFRSVRNISRRRPGGEESGALFLLVLVRQPLRPVALPAYKVGIARVRPCSFIGVR